MDRRGFRALPEHEQVWAVPVSSTPAAYNLRGHLATLTEQEEDESTSQAAEDEHATRTQAQRPFKAKQKVVPGMHVTRGLQTYHGVLAYALAASRSL